MDIHRQNGLRFTIALLDQLNNKEKYKMEDFPKDSEVLEKLLKALGMWDKEEDLDLVRKLCAKELDQEEVIEISNQDKKFILRYL